MRLKTARQRRQRLGPRARTPGEAVGNDVAVDQLHHERGPGGRILEAADPGNGQVIQSGDEARLAFEVCEPLRIVAMVVGSCDGNGWWRTNRAGRRHALLCLRRPIATGDYFFALSTVIVTVAELDGELIGY
jgi:hypothetical protein